MDCSDKLFVMEIFLVCNDHIYLMGVLVKNGAGYTETHGLVEFKKGEKHYFRSPAIQLITARRNLATICENIGEYFKAEVNSLKIDQWMSTASFSLLLKKTNSELEH